MIPNIIKKAMYACSKQTSDVEVGCDECELYADCHKVMQGQIGHVGHIPHPGNDTYTSYAKTDNMNDVDYPNPLPVTIIDSTLRTVPQEYYNAMKHCHKLTGGIACKTCKMAGFCDRTTATIGNKPPLGLLPKYMWDKQRLDDILGAFSRYCDEQRAIPELWLAEYNHLVKGDDHNGQ